MATAVYDRCGVYFPQVPGLFAAKHAMITDSPSAQLRLAMPRLDLTDEERDELLQP